MEPMLHGTIINLYGESVSECNTNIFILKFASRKWQTKNHLFIFILENTGTYFFKIYFGVCNGHSIAGSLFFNKKSTDV